MVPVATVLGIRHQASLRHSSSSVGVCCFYFVSSVARGGRKSDGDIHMVGPGVLSGFGHVDGTCIKCLDLGMLTEKLHTVDLGSHPDLSTLMKNQTCWDFTSFHTSAVFVHRSVRHSLRFMLMECKEDLGPLGQSV